MSINLHEFHYKCENCNAQIFTILSSEDIDRSTFEGNIKTVCKCCNCGSLYPLEDVQLYLEHKCVDSNHHKFRGKTFNDYWVYGFRSVSSIIRPNDTSTGTIEIPVITGTITQFTGHYDISGTEIYEGDVLQFKVYDGDVLCDADESAIPSTVKGYVKYIGADICSYVVFFSEGGGFCRFRDCDVKEFKVVGTIFDAKE